MKKDTFHALMAIATIAVGVYMLYTYSWPTPPFVSGLGFLFAGLGLWTEHCPILNKFLK